MNDEDLYIGTQWDSETEEERERIIQNYIPASLNNLLQRLAMGLPIPDKYDKARFDQRKPALGLTAADLQLLKKQGSPTDPWARKQVFNFIRDKCLKTLIPVDGAKDMQELVTILEAELQSGTPAPVPDWYSFSSKTFGPRRTGYYSCSAKGCFRAESPARQFMKCSQCKISVYCGPECQKKDWNARHKHVCGKGAEGRDQIKQVSKMLEIFKQMESRQGMKPEQMGALMQAPAGRGGISGGAGQEPRRRARQNDAASSQPVECDLKVAGGGFGFGTNLLAAVAVLIFLGLVLEYFVFL